MIPPAAANPLPAPAPGVDSDGADQFPWRAFTRRGLRNQVLCAGIALLIWLVTSGLRGNLLSAWVCSAAIGTSSWFFFDGSRLLLAGWLPQTKRLPGARRVRWPGPGWMLLCIVGGTALGYTVGSAIGDAVTGFSTPSLLDDRPALATSLVAAIAATGYFYVTERLHQEQANAETARRAVTESQLRLLQSQLEPHRLFNTLANLRLLVTLDPPRAQAILDRLIGDLRATLGASRQDLHPLADEFTMFDDYLALMSMRMGPRLQVQLSLPEALRHLPVPPAAAAAPAHAHRPHRRRRTAARCRAAGRPGPAVASPADRRHGGRWPQRHGAGAGAGTAAAAVFFDIGMPGASGLEAAQALAEDWPDAAPFPLLIFVTAYDQYALAAFDAQAVDYLVKPVDTPRLAACVARLQARLADRRPAAAAVSRSVARSTPPPAPRQPSPPPASPARWTTRSCSKTWRSCGRFARAPDPPVATRAGAAARWPAVLAGAPRRGRASLGHHQHPARRIGQGLAAVARPARAADRQPAVRPLVQGHVAAWAAPGDAQPIGPDRPFTRQCAHI